jgi:hypothetical protein
MGRGTYNAYVVALDISQLTGFGGPRTQQLSKLCYHDQELWCTRKRLVFDIFVEPYCPERVARQFGRAQVFPLP